MSNYNTTHVEYIDRIRTAYIMWKDIAVATITEEYSSLSGESSWVIRPNYTNYALAKEKYGKTIDLCGIDEDLRLEEYVRRYVPVFVEQRTFPKCRSDLPPLLRKVGLSSYDLFEFLCRTHGVCGNDSYYVSRTPDIIIDVDDPNFPYDIPSPELDTSSYGWLV